MSRAGFQDEDPQDAEADREPRTSMAEYAETGWCPRHRRTYTGNFYACPECGAWLVIR